MPSIALYPEDSLLHPIVKQYAIRHGIEYVTQDADLTVIDKALHKDITIPENTMLLTVGKGEDIAPPVELETFFHAIAARLAQGGITMGCYMFLADIRQLVHTKTEQSIDLTEKETALLLALYEAGETGIERNQLLDRVWGYGEDIDTHTVQTHMYRLRQKLEGIEIIGKDGGYRLVINP